MRPEATCRWVSPSFLAVSSKSMYKNDAIRISWCGEETKTLRATYSIACNVSTGFTHSLRPKALCFALLHVVTSMDASSAALERFEVHLGAIFPLFSIVAGHDRLTICTSFLKNRTCPSELLQAHFSPCHEGSAPQTKLTPQTVLICRRNAWVRRSLAFENPCRCLSPAISLL